MIRTSAFVCSAARFSSSGNIAAVDDDVSVSADVLLKFGDLLGGHADDRLLPLRVDVGSAWAEELDTARDVDER